MIALRIIEGPSRIALPRVEELYQLYQSRASH